MLHVSRPSIGEEEISEVVACLQSGWLATGPRVRRFEEEFAAYVGVRHAVAVSSGTAGLHLALLALGIGPGDEVITTPMTFAATGNTICLTRARPVFVDIEKGTYNIDLTKIPELISDRTRAVLPVHFAGQPCDMDQIRALASRHHLFVIEDAAHAVGAEYKGRKIGTLGDVAVFSFHPAKNMTTGEGGMVTTEDDQIARQIRLLRFHGLEWDGYRHAVVSALGFKYNMMDLQAALGLCQLPRLDGFIEVRQHLAALYDAGLAAVPEIITPSLAPYPLRHARHLYPVLVDIDALQVSRDECLARLSEVGIHTAVHYIALHLHPYYRQAFGYRAGDFPHAEYVSDRIMSLPLFPGMMERDVADVIGAVKSVIKK